MVQIPIAMLLRCKYLLLSFYKKRKMKRKEDASSNGNGACVRSQIFVAWPFQAALVFSATNLPTCSQLSGTMLFGHYLPAVPFFFCLRWIWAHLERIGFCTTCQLGELRQASLPCFFFLVRKISYKFNFLIRFKHITSVVFKNNDNVMRWNLERY